MSDHEKEPVSDDEEPQKTSRKRAPKVVQVADLRKRTTDSESVKLLQKELGVKETGTYDGHTQAAVRRWQNENGFTGGRGLMVSADQAKKLFGEGYSISAE